MLHYFRVKIATLFQFYCNLVLFEVGEEGFGGLEMAGVDEVFDFFKLVGSAIFAPKFEKSVGELEVEGSSGECGIEMLLSECLDFFEISGLVFA